MHHVDRPTGLKTVFTMFGGKSEQKYVYRDTRS